MDTAVFSGIFFDMKNTHRRVVTGLSCLLSLGLLLAAGPLNPPAGAVAPTAKPLSEVEPRTAINAANTPGDANSLFKITQPGSYYLTANVNGVASKIGIEIATSDVTVDLNGFSLIGVAGSLQGIAATVSASNVTIRNGNVTGWGGNGVEASISSSSSGIIIEGVSATQNGGIGIRSSAPSLLTACSASSNGGSSGFSLSAASTLSNCTATLNTGHGFAVGDGCTLSGCTARLNLANGFVFSSGCNFSNCTSTSNQDNGYSSLGAGSACNFTACTAVSNTNSGFVFQVDCTVSNCTARQNGGYGFTSGFYLNIRGCTATYNTLDGIRCGGGSSLVINNLCGSNGYLAGDGAGIHLLVSGSRVEGNTCLSNDRGIDVDGSSNIIVRNNCRSNTTNWDVVAGNVCLVVQGLTGGAINGNTGGVAPGSTDPNANFSH